jgi:hypothetical protein
VNFISNSWFRTEELIVEKLMAVIVGACLQPEINHLQVCEWSIVGRSDGREPIDGSPLITRDDDERLIDGEPIDGSPLIR